MQQSRLGLAQPGAATAKAGKARAPIKTAPKRTGPIWDTVEVVTNEMSNTPHVKCKQCDMKFSAGLTRVTEHITGMGCITCCPCEDDWFLTLKQKLVEESVDKHEKKKQKTTETEVDEMVDEPNPVKTEFKFSQQNIKSSMNASTAADVDAAIAEFCYGCNISANIISHPLFKKMYEKMRTAPASYKLPTRDRINGDLLDSTVARLKAQDAPIRAVTLKDGGTVVSDGWDDVAKNHLINFLVGTAKGFFFDGTIELKSEDSENAERVAELIIIEIEKVGKLTTVQVVTDTCSVMKAAWRIIEAKLPWVTCTCCGPHVLSLELTDIGKIPEVAAVIKKVGRVLNRFWGRTRWARTKLRETVETNHKKKIGLYRAKVTRFAGKVREMGRMLRLKADLQQVCIPYQATFVIETSRGSHTRPLPTSGSHL